MKVIDLLNKIAKGEEVPKEIVYNTRIFRYNEYNKCYIWNCDGDEFYLSTYYRLESILNDEIEIIEEEKDIEEFNYFNNNKFINTPNGMTKTDRNHLDSNFEEIRLQINNIKRELNKIKKEGK